MNSTLNKPKVTVANTIAITPLRFLYIDIYSGHN